MQRILVAIVIIAQLTACKNNKEEKVESTQGNIESQTVKADENTGSEEKKEMTTINWKEMPDLKDIGNFPFITAPKNWKIANEKEGLSEYFPYEKMENYTGSGFYTTEGRLGVIHFEGDDYNQRFFDKSILSYLDDLGAKKIHQGTLPSDDESRSINKENMYSGKYRTVGISASTDPISLYAFKNNGKNYMVNVQSNSAQGEIFIMEIEPFQQTIKKYTSQQMLSDISAKGKAILNINFDTDQSTLKPDGAVIVEEIVKLMKENPNLKISIEGHTDNSGSATRNKILSDERANSVLNTLAGSGINKSNLKAKGYGSEKPLVDNDNEENKAINRRVELVKF
ncbi:OmpA family protein [Kaistella jeonii]|uniref:OmpA family protein n=1 Tax=Kaistella jeonii TaxID=266749 RepID=UPI0006926012|nr:OmpA family protein [Kaistella jeonii]SFC31814.1 OmpA family protein [Kaistella jeonii]VEI95623.1 Inner membrane lipoprotein YiaD precursor [Kaistella jeonii]